MASQNTNPFYSSSGGGIPANGGQQRLALDNLLRRELRVGDPNDPSQIAQALLERYKDDPRANAITQEARGLPFLLDAQPQVVGTRAPTSCETELKQAIDDVNSDLQELTTNTLLKDSTSELRGWAQAIRALIAEGTTAARFGLDTRQRDKVFSIRRQLGDYARLARMIGALTPALNSNFRSFAKSLDEVAAVFLVMMGEALANVGFNGGRFLLQVPYTELQVRREAAVAALRNLTGSTQVSSFYQNDWQWGLNAYRKLYKFLDDQGQGDLRILLMENELARAMDELIQRAAHGTVDGLRALGATAEVDLDRFRRLVAIGNQLGNDAPPLGAFFDALLLFVQSFDAAGGFRLLRVARPPILFYGLYGTGFASLAEKRLLDLITSRGLLADKADCYLQCGCSDGAVRCQMLIDKVLYDIDRAIDLYTVGDSEWGEPEIRAGAYGFLAKALAEDNITFATTECPSSDIKMLLQDIVGKLIPQDLSISWSANEHPYRQLINLNDAEMLQLSDSNRALVAQFQSEYKNVSQWQLTDLSAFLDAQKPKLPADWTFTAVLDATPSWQTLMKSELCNQFNREIQDSNGRGLRRIVETIAPNCIAIDTIFGDLKALINAAISKINVDNSDSCQVVDVDYPKTVAAGVVAIADALKHRHFREPKKVIMANSTPLLTAANQPSEVTDDEANMLIVSRLVKNILSAAKEADSEERAAAIDAFEQFAADNKELVTNLHLSDNFKKIVEAFNSIPNQSHDAQAQTKNFMALKERCIDLVSVIGLGIKR